MAAKIEPARPANAAPRPYASSLLRTRLMPSACATSSSSRSAIQARPRREFSSRQATKAANGGADQRQVEQRHRRAQHVAADARLGDLQDALRAAEQRRGEIRHARSRARSRPAPSWRPRDSRRAPPAPAGRTARRRQTTATPRPAWPPSRTGAAARAGCRRSAARWCRRRRRRRRRSQGPAARPARPRDSGPCPSGCRGRPASAPGRYTMPASAGNTISTSSAHAGAHHARALVIRRARDWRAMRALRGAEQRALSDPAATTNTITAPCTVSPSQV